MSISGGEIARAMTSMLGVYLTFNDFNKVNRSTPVAALFPHASTQLQRSFFGLLYAAPATRASERESRNDEKIPAKDIEMRPASEELLLHVEVPVANLASHLEVSASALLIVPSVHMVKSEPSVVAEVFS